MKNTATRHAPRRILTPSQNGEDAALRYPVRSGSCSSSEGSTAISVTRCSLTLVERRAPRAANQLSRSRPREVCRRITSRSPMRREANCEVPPCSLPAQRRINVLPQFSTIRFAIAMAPSTITRMTAMGVNQARMFVCSAVAPVMNGELWACASSGAQARSAPAAARRCAVVTEAVSITCMVGLLAVALADPLRFAHTLCADGQARRLAVSLRVTLLALGLAGRTEAETLDDE